MRSAQNTREWQQISKALFMCLGVASPLIFVVSFIWTAFYGLPMLSQMSVANIYVCGGLPFAVLAGLSVLGTRYGFERGFGIRLF